eukprot:2560460-Alexandrium_andersonii.AAC.1
MACNRSWRPGASRTSLGRSSGTSSACGLGPAALAAWPGGGPTAASYSTRGTPPRAVTSSG